MKLFQNIFSSLLLLIFIFYSLGILNHYENKDEALMDCSMKKSCSCCEMNSTKTKSCCSSHTKKLSLILDLPCHHPNFEGINFKFDPQDLIIFNSREIISARNDFLIINFTNHSHAFLQDLVKPPQA
jgi:hypothetical protein